MRVGVCVLVVCVGVLSSCRCLCSGFVCVRCLVFCRCLCCVVFV